MVNAEKLTPNTKEKLEENNIDLVEYLSIHYIFQNWESVNTTIDSELRTTLINNQDQFLSFESELGIQSTYQSLESISPSHETSNLSNL